MDNDNLDPNHVAWSRNLFNSLNEGGAWGVPRSGLIFNKHGEEFHLVARMPHDPAMPITATQLQEQQDGDIKSITAYFGAAGIKVVNLTKESVR